MAISGGAGLTTGPTGPKPTGPPVPQPKSTVQVKAHTRAVPTAKPKGNAAKAKGRGATQSPLLNPNQTLSGPPLLNAAKQLAATQTQEPIAELQKQIATNNAQTQGTINLTGGYYNQLE